MRQRMGLVVAAGVLTGLLTADAGHGQGTKVQYNLVPFSKLKVSPKHAADKGGKLDDKGKGDKYDPRESKSSPADLADALNDLGKDGWEAVAMNRHGVMVRKSGPDPWEYRVLKIPDAGLTGKGPEDETVLLALQALTSQGWEPCLFPDDTSLICKRQKQRQPPAKG